MGHVYISRNVVFDETIFPFSRQYSVSFKDFGNFVSSTTDTMTNVHDQLLDVVPAGPLHTGALPNQGDHIDHHAAGADPDASKPSTPGSASFSGSTAMAQDSSMPGAPPTPPSTSGGPTGAAQQPGSHAMSTRLRDGISLPKQRTDGIVTYMAMRSDDLEHASVTDALQDPR
jgi:hypothetical protein